MSETYNTSPRDYKDTGGTEISVTVSILDSNGNSILQCGSIRISASRLLNAADPAFAISQVLGLVRNIIELAVKESAEYAAKSKESVESRRKG